MKNVIIKLFTKHPIWTVGVILPTAITAVGLQFPDTAQIPLLRDCQMIRLSEAAVMPTTSKTTSAPSMAVASAQSTSLATKKGLTPQKISKAPKTAKPQSKETPAKLASKPSHMPDVQAAPQVTLPKPASMQSLTKAEMTLLIHAREAYWKRNAPTSIADYKKLLREVPNHPGIYGELGNVYYMTGQYAQAGKAYAAAAREMIRLRYYAEAYGLLPLIGSLNPHEASIIAHTLSAQRNASTQKSIHPDKNLHR
ncbi:hypothetical protein ACJU26_08220 [Acidithiobacillus sp. M4-SHS-6]|uniref:hypothetical protein n=1 Tax=Acidithiobacillus sp. M4-SHS-6 TaxID=3383024 RepID=UPI0039BE3C8E